MNFNSDDIFFNENIVKVNKTVERILFAAAIVPLAFIILTVIGIWIVPHLYSTIILAYELTVSFIMFFLNRNKKFAYISMYFGVLAIVGFVDLLGAKDVIVVTISFCFAPFISCLYYNRRLTNIVNTVDYLSLIIVYRLRSLEITDVSSLVYEESSPMAWFISHFIGVTIEFIFVFIVSDAVSKRTNNTLKDFIETSKERNQFIVDMEDRNRYIIKVNNEIEDKNRRLSETQFSIIEFVAQCLGSHDLFTGQHVMHTKKYVEIIARELKNEGYYPEELSDRNIDLFSTAAFLHDIGKIHIPEGVLNKIGKFTPEEFELMKCHPEEGKKLLQFLPKIDDGKFNEIALDMAYFHHEKWDGTGYPNGISGKDIPLCARIMTAADVLDALTSQRLYKDPMSVKEAMKVFAQSSGTHFEPCIAQAVCNCEGYITLVDEDFKTKEANVNAQELEWWHKYHSNFEKK